MVLRESNPCESFFTAAEIELPLNKKGVKLERTANLRNVSEYTDGKSFTDCCFIENPLVLLTSANPGILFHLPARNIAYF
ncbi:MAG: hypothetical protein CMJ81_21155 [Planctomycetaceae bacterium]|nr:hypothetical protein [Planctomycetaceae bacterium]